MTEVASPQELTCYCCGRIGARGFERRITEDAATVFRCTNVTGCDARVEKAQRIADREAARAEREAVKAARAALVGCCIDCAADPDIDTSDRKKWRPAEAPGPRCVTHKRAMKKRRSQAKHGRHIENGFGMTGEQYQILYAMQGGKCFICQWATGKTKRLAVDHDHNLAAEHGHDPRFGCPLCWRALLCGQCNQMIGRLGVEALARAMVVLGPNPPARGVFVIDDDIAMEQR